MKELIGPYVATLRWVADDTPVSCWRHSGELLLFGQLSESAGKE